MASHVYHAFLISMGNVTLESLRWHKHPSARRTRYNLLLKDASFPVATVVAYHKEDVEPENHCWRWSVNAVIEGLSIVSPDKYGPYKKLGDAKRACAGYVARYLLGSDIACPKCGNRMLPLTGSRGNHVLEEGFHLEETVFERYTSSPIRYTVGAELDYIEADGTIHMTGYTHAENVPSPAWETQTPKVNQHGYYKLFCVNCHHSWFDPRIHHEHEGED